MNRNVNIALLEKYNFLINFEKPKTNELSAHTFNKLTRMILEYLKKGVNIKIFEY